MAAAEETPQKTGPSLLIQVAVLLVLTAAAIGAGWLAGQHLNSSQRGSAAAHDAGKEENTEEAAPGAVAQGSLYALPAVTTNLAGTGDTWVRMELVLVFDGAADSAIAEFVHQDVLAYLRTIKLRQVEGASGFQHLKSDLEERAQVRTGGKVKSILIRTLLFE
jgi:flagellar FliL protein